MTLIRPLLPADVAYLLDIYRPFIENSAVSFEAEVPDLKNFTERLTGIANKFPFLVLEEMGQILGYAYAAQHRERAAYRWCVETSIYMHPNAKGKGLGKQLYSALLDQLILRKFTLAYALITQPNEASVAVHSSCGFTHLSMHKNAGFKLGKWHDVLWMEKELAPCETEPQEPLFGHG